MKKFQILSTGILLLIMAAPAYAIAQPQEPTPAAAVISTQQIQPYAQATTGTPTQQAAKPATTTKPELPKFAPGQEPFSMEIAVPKPAGARQFNIEVAAGNATEDSVIIKNFADHELHFSLYAADPTVTNTGSAAYKTRGETTAKGPGAWVKFEEGEIDLASNTAKRVKFTVTVPADAAPGDYRAGIAMEKSAKDINNPGITINARFIIQANIKIKGAVAGALNTAANSAPNQDGWRVYYYAGAIILFVASVGLLAWLIINDKRKKKVAPAKKTIPATPAKVVKKTKTKKAKK